MPNQKKLTPYELQNPETLKKISRQAEELVFYNQQKEARLLAESLEKSIRDLGNDWQEKYETIIARLKFSTIQSFNDPEVERLFTEHALEAFGNEFKIFDVLKYKFISIPAWERDKFKQALRKALHANNQTITSNRLRITKQGQQKEASPTITNWLDDYNRNLGSDLVSNLKQNEFFSTNSNFQALPEKEKSQIKELFTLYEELKKSSLVPENSPESILIGGEDGQLKILEKGQFYNISKGPSKEEQKPRPPILIDYNQKTQEILTRLNLNLADKNFASRLSSIIATRLRNIRTFITTKETLMRPPKIGGLGLAPEKAEAIARLIEAEAKKIHASSDFLSQKKQSQKIPEKILPSQTYSLQKSINQKQGPSPAGPTSTQAPPAPPSPKPAHLSKPKPIKPKVLPRPRPAPSPVPQKVQEIKPFQNFPTSKPSPKNRVESSSPRPTSSFREPPRTPKAKPSLESIQSPPSRIIGGVEEVGALTLADFRRWSGEPAEAAARIKEKINSLEVESFEKKAAAISAWQNSEVNNLYLDIGRASMESGQSVETIINQRSAQKQPTLSLEEFNAVVDLNRELSY